MARVIRVAAAEDESELRRLWDLMAGEAAARGQSWQDFSIRHVTSDRYLAVVVEEADALLGCAYVKLGDPNPEHGPVEVDLDTEPSRLLAAYVVPEAQGQGLFQELISTASAETLKRSTALLIETPRSQPMFVTKKKRRFGFF